MPVVTSSRNFGGQMDSAASASCILVLAQPLLVPLAASVLLHRLLSRGHLFLGVNGWSYVLAFLCPNSFVFLMVWSASLCSSCTRWTSCVCFPVAAIQVRLVVAARQGSCRSTAWVDSMPHLCSTDATIRNAAEKCLADLRQRDKVVISVYPTATGRCGCVSGTVSHRWLVLQESFMLRLTEVVCNESVALAARLQAGLQMKNALSSEASDQLRQKRAAYMSIPEQSRGRLKAALLGALGTAEPRAAHVAAQARCPSRAGFRLARKPQPGLPLFPALVAPLHEAQSR